MSQRRIYLGLLTGVGLWVGLILLAPYARGAGWPIAAPIYDFFRPVCHQNPDRSFLLLTEPLAVCHRCFGIYLGFAAGMVITPWLPRLRGVFLRKPKLILVGAVLMAIDVLLLPNTWSTRFLTGFLTAFPAAVFVLEAAGQISATWITSPSERPASPLDSQPPSKTPQVKESR